MKTKTRTKVLNVMMTETEMSKLTQLAGVLGNTKSNLVRDCIRELFIKNGLQEEPKNIFKALK
jgi:tRNA A37 threonylcarbamoyladenosine biosynthesis protein TsaE